MFSKVKVLYWELYVPVIQALRRLRQEDRKFYASLGYTVSSRTVWGIYLSLCIHICLYVCIYTHTYICSCFFWMNNFILEI
jgi:hypothetical protein